MVTATDRQLLVTEEPTTGMGNHQDNAPGSLQYQCGLLVRPFLSRRSAVRFTSRAQCRAEIRRQDGDLVQSASVTFHRALIGDALAEAIKQITPSCWLTPFSD